MPRRRRGWGPPKPKTPRAPKMPKPAPLPRPKSQDLRAIYKGLLTVSVQNRIATLAYALQWYDTALPYVISKGQLPADAPKRLETAVKCRKQAIGTNVDHEKETAFSMAIRCYEKACAKVNPPLLDKMLDELKAKQSVLAAKQASLEQRFGFITKILQDAIGSRVKIEVADAQKLVQYNPALTTISYNREAVKTMAEQFKREGLMPVFLDQLDVLSRHAALTSDGNGGLQYSPEDQIKAMDEMLKHFAQFCKGPDAPKRLIRNAPQLQPQAQPAALGSAAPRPPRPPRQFTSGPRVGGKYKGGSALAHLWTVLSDELEHEELDALKGNPAMHPLSIVKMVQADGVLTGNWILHRNGTKIRMEILNPALKPGAVQQPQPQAAAQP